jgi:pimeloyl-ACP methyl ester carboxylesterase
MAEIAADYARAIEEEFQGKAVDLFGISTSGSLALQFAADYPGLVHKLALIATAYHLGPLGQDVQRRYADLLEHGNYRHAFQALAQGLAASPAGQWFLGGLMWLSAPSQIEDPQGMVALLRAEDAFDVGNRLNDISAPTLLIGGDQDRLYPPELVKQTAERLPHARLILYQKHSHRETIADRRLFQDILPFLIDECAR